MNHFDARPAQDDFVSATAGDLYRPVFKRCSLPTFVKRIGAHIMNPVESRRVIQRLEQEGWVLDRVRGSHHQFYHPGKAGKRVTVVHPKKDLNIKTLRSIMKQAGWEHL